MESALGCTVVGVKFQTTCMIVLSVGEREECQKIGLKAHTSFTHTQAMSLSLVHIIIQTHTHTHTHTHIQASITK